MKTLTLSLWAFTAYCQVQIFNPLEGMIKARIEAERILNERRRINIEEERMRLENQRLQQQSQDPGQSAQDAAIDAALTTVVARFPDFWEFRPEMARITGLLSAKSMSAEEYAEGVYLMAKFATFSQSPRKRTPSECVSSQSDSAIESLRKQMADIQQALRQMEAKRRTVNLDPTQIERVP